MFKTDKDNYDFLNQMTYIGEKQALSCYEIEIKKGHQATGFILDYKHEQYLITAAHAVSVKKRYKNREIIVKRNDKEVKFHANIYYHDMKKTDVCVIPIPEEIRFPESVKYEKINYVVGSECLIYGHPDRIPNNIAVYNYDNYHRMPVLRKGILSAIASIDSIFTLVFDIQTLPGYSGSPIFLYDRNKRLKIAGVIFGAAYDTKNIIDEEEQEYSYSYQVDTGFTFGIPIYYVIEIIEEKILKK